jgi:hypothetical protein
MSPSRRGRSGGSRRHGLDLISVGAGVAQVRAQQTARAIIDVVQPPGRRTGIWGSRESPPHTRLGHSNVGGGHCLWPSDVAKYVGCDRAHR